MQRGGVIARPLPESPLCTLVIPCYNEEAFIESALRAATTQDYPSGQIEILVVDGRSTDRTRAIVARMATEDPRIQLLDNPGRIQSAGMNCAIRRARGEIICRMDAHADYAPDYLTQSVAALRRTGALNAGGAARPRHQTEFQRALCVALGSPLGVGGSAYRDPTREGFVETVFNGAFRREAFEIAGLYDPGAITNEDAELNQRIIKAGGRIYLSRSIVVHYYPRSSLGALVRQYFSYGVGRARTLAKHGSFLSLRPLIPFFTVSGLTLLASVSLLVPRVLPLFLAAMLLYACAVAVGAVLAARHHGATGLVWILMVIFPAMHVAHGLGFGVGLVRHGWALHQARREPERLGAR
jgi:cellulose synthase/poly-beta-1,6-N-acetylglucosamine synthase-like glycosyltransferase